MPATVSTVFGIGTYEMLIILAVGLMLFSPKELPGVLRGIARFWASVRRTADEFRDAIMQDEDLREVRDVLDEARSDLLAAEQAAREELVKARMQVREAEAKLAAAVRRSEAETIKTHAAALEDEAARLQRGPSTGGDASATREQPPAATATEDDPAGGFADEALRPPGTVAAVAPATPSRAPVKAPAPPPAKDPAAGAGAA